MNMDDRLPAHRSGPPVAIDAMGGDKGLAVQVEGAVAAYKEYGVRSILVGPERDIQPLLDSLGAKHFPVSFKHAPEVIGMDESPARAVRRKPDSSLCVAYELVQQGVASSIISAGNSGAMMAAGQIICGLLPGIDRPAITTLIPKVGDGRPNVILDIGANVDCHARNLVQFGIMGSIYHSALFNSLRPKIALLSNGTESSKGTDIIRAAAFILSQMDTFNYVGFVEGRDVATGFSDVIVCDGFVGNVLLKAMEGCVRLIFEQLLHESQKGFFRRVGFGLSRGMYRDVFAERFDYTSYGGAPLLGLAKLALVLHGSSDSRAVKNAVRAADAFDRSGMIDQLAAALTQFDDSMPRIEDDFLMNMFSKDKPLAPKAKRAARSKREDDTAPGADIRTVGQEPNAGARFDDVRDQEEEV